MGGTIANSWPLIQPEKAVKCAENTQNHQKWTEPGPYGSVWADTCTESIPRALGSLWDASRALKRPQKSKNPGFGGLGVRGEASPLFPLFALKGCGQKFNNPMQRLGPSAKAAGPDFEAAGPDFEAAGPDFEAAVPDFEAARPDVSVSDKVRLQ